VRPVPIFSTVCAGSSHCRLDGRLPYALGTVFLLSMEYTGTPSSLSSATLGFLGQATASGGFYTFNSSLTLLPNHQYFFYENALIPTLTLTGGNIIAGANQYASVSATNGNFFTVGSRSLNFRVTGSPAGVPDSGTTVSLLGFASARLGCLAAQIALLRFW
jgi:hypothetical protein